MNDQIPLYIGIPLALICLSVFGFVCIFIYGIIVDIRDRRD